MSEAQDAVVRALAAAEARIRGLEEAARDMCREWRLHRQLTDSCRPMERVLGIHAPFCPTWGHKDCECDLSLAPPPEAAKCPDCDGRGWYTLANRNGGPEQTQCQRCFEASIPPAAPLAAEGKEKEK